MKDVRSGMRLMGSRMEKPHENHLENSYAYGIPFEKHVGGAGTTEQFDDGVLIATRTTDRGLQPKSTLTSSSANNPLLLLLAFTSIFAKLPSV